MARKREAKKPSTKSWQLIERVVAIAHRAPGVMVQRNIRLPAIRQKGKKKRKREIDVLLTGQISGYSVFIPIECKDHKRPVDVGKIDNFIGKLKDVGLPTQASIFVSSSGYSDGAIDRAEKVGMKTLTVEPNSSNDAPIQIQAALQSIIFMCCHYSGISFQTETEIPLNYSRQYLSFYDSEGDFMGTIPDIIWSQWMQGDPPLVCGKYTRKFNIPEEWRFIGTGERNIGYNYAIDIDVEAVVFQFAGEIASHTLRDAVSGQATRGVSEVHFDPSNPPGIKVVHSEEELQELLSTRVDVSINVGRIRIPRVLMDHNLFWPLSSQANARANELSQLPHLSEEKKIQEIANVNLESLWDFSSFKSVEIIKIR